jgi:opacity protein-like surface antigen
MSVLARRLSPVALVAMLAGLAAPPAHAQLLAAGLGPAWPSGDLEDRFNADNALFITGRVNASLAFLMLQFELSHTDWNWEDGGSEAKLDIWQPAINLGFRFIRAGPVRPYVLAGVLGSNQKITTSSDPEGDSGVHFGYQAGGGIDFKVGPLRPFVEFRVVKIDGPEAIDVRYMPLIFGIGIL